ncbi:hypothetical protein ACFS2C_03190 [Prauserella oleivorans]|uniref:Uncharacterized protein n=1 Tax=Prauserella oleivorans TaxID=1478153 RepID=A0ABW5W4I4_9PSEU
MERLLERADALELRAPELALVLGERAAALAETAGANELWVRAEALVVHARVRLGHRASTVGRAVAALRAAEDAGQPVLAAQLRTDLAVCARSVGAPLTGLAILRPVLTVAGLSSVQRATALCHLVGCLGTLGRKPELDRVLLEGDRIVSGDDTLSVDDKLVARALIRISVSAHRRRHGDVMGAADAARTGIGFLDHLEDPDTDGGLARVRLVLELVCALLDRGEGELALEVAQPLLDAPERAAAVAPAGWLRLALATRVLQCNGAAESAGRMLRDALYNVSRHDLHALASRLWLELANVEERVGQASEAVTCLHNARAAEQRYARARSQARAVLTSEFGSGEQAPVDLADVIASAARASMARTAQQQSDAQAGTSAPAQAHSDRAAEAVPAHAVPAETDAPAPAPAAASTRGSDSESTSDSPPRPRVVLPMLRLPPEHEAAARSADVEATAILTPVTASGAHSSEAPTNGGNGSRAVRHSAPLGASVVNRWSHDSARTATAGSARATAPTGKPETARADEPGSAAEHSEPSRGLGGARADQPGPAESARDEVRSAVGGDGGGVPSDWATEPAFTVSRHSTETQAGTDSDIASPPSESARGGEPGGTAGQGAAEAASHSARHTESHEDGSTTSARGTDHLGYGESGPGRRARRHDAEHGSVAARSVFDRLGISLTGGGRRRAAEGDSGERGRRAAAESGEPERLAIADSADFAGAASDPGDPRSDDALNRADAHGTGDPVGGGTHGAGDGGVDGTYGTGETDARGTDSSGDAEQTGAPTTGIATTDTGATGIGTTGDTREPSTDTGNRSAAAETSGSASGDHRESPFDDDSTGLPSDGYGWLPRLRLPPSLAPLDELRPESDVAEPVQDSTDPAPALPLDDPPPDAGLAELLARALAEHHASTSGAAALATRFGADDGDRDQPRAVNGRRHRGDH